jgi:hypothetical protein
MKPFLVAALLTWSLASLTSVVGQTTLSSPFTARILSVSPVIESVSPEGDPIRPFLSNGDLWLNTWADDDNVYSGWGDGLGVVFHTDATDCGIARFSGSFPSISAIEQCINAPTALPDVNDKPSSLLFFNKRLYGHFHSPLGDAWIGYLAYSDDYGKTWIRVGFYSEGKTAPPNASPWTRDKKSRFRCSFFVNMGKSYNLNTDGYVYALGIGTEWSWIGGTFLMRVRKEDILNYSAWEYLSGLVNEQPIWSSSEDDATPLANVLTLGQGSAMYHPGISRYLFLTSDFVYDAPNPWGPWTLAGRWVDRNSPIQWQGGYQPGIVSKDTGPDSFWFTIAGQNASPMIIYSLQIGRMKMKLRVVDVRRETPSPTELRLSQNYPNPFSAGGGSAFGGNPSTAISYQLPAPSGAHPERSRGIEGSAISLVTLRLYDLLGREVTTLVNEVGQPGVHTIRWDGRNDRGAKVSSGIYLYQLRAGTSVVSKTMVLMK